MSSLPIAEFVLDCTAAGLSPRTVAWYRWSLDIFERFARQRPIDPHLCRAFIAAYQAKSASPYTIRNFVKVLKRFFAWCVDQELRVDNPAASLRIPKLPRRVPRGITLEDFRQLYAVASVRDRALLLVLIDSGVRLSEVSSLLLDHVDLNAGLFRVLGKGNQERFGFLSPITCEIVSTWLAVHPHRDEGYLFVTDEGAPLKPKGIYEILRRLKKRAGVRGACNPHAFRHGFAREYLLRGGDLASLSSILGHSDVRTTMIYASFTRGELQRQHQRYSPAAALGA